MKNLFIDANKRSATLQEKLFMLTKTKKITEEDIKEEHWKCLSSEYQRFEDIDWVRKATLSFTNSILHQRKKYFCLSRNSLRELLKNDENFPKKVGMDNRKYRFFLRFVQDFLVKLVYKGKNRNSAYIYEVVHQDLLDVLKLTEEDSVVQLKETQAFSDGRDPWDVECDDVEDNENVESTNSDINPITSTESPLEAIIAQNPPNVLPMPRKDDVDHLPPLREVSKDEKDRAIKERHIQDGDFSKYLTMDINAAEEEAKKTTGMLGKQLSNMG